MTFLRHIGNWIFKLFRNNTEFLVLLKFVESLVSKILSLYMIALIFFALYDIAVFLWQELFFHSPDPLRSRLFDAFGLFLNVLIALELLENITAYLKNHVIQLELVIVTAIIAIARKVIIFDIEKYPANNLVAIAITVVLLSFSYFLITIPNRSRKS
ncbi:phosphate-starvation-inducible PsiE family protein [Spirulina sp. CCNP1310]|uniref:phosphate-starvation-inducible PsiE family protein n=1 Tax=Spirulina sp. CCNP1310 TaxID=3110249 RepID=UPI002B205585|nr:phosphate-starvation-inducible PsiE family protein [Spirulina sp. CCNP1310]MEA5421106.1 phosphate-starvation-inducible PsiE family protein [Spirulina sp. CCNP1310]